MKLVLSILCFIATITTAKSATVGADLASVLNKLKAFDFTAADEAVLESIPIQAYLWIFYIDYDCVEQKLDITNVDKSQIYDIGNLTKFESLNINHKKLFVAIGNAAKICTRSSKEFKDRGIEDILTLRAFMAKFIFPDVRLNQNRAEECFKWALSKVEPNSPLVEGFDADSMNTTVEKCKEKTSVESYRLKIEEDMNKLNIRSCDVDTYGQPSVVGYNIMKMFLFSKVAEKIPQQREELGEEVIKFEADLLETQMNCILKDLREDK